MSRRTLPRRVAHRGGSYLAPENTLAAFRNALTLPVDAIELDVHMSRDGRAIVLHDNSVGRRSNGRGNILDLDFAYLRGLNAAAHFPGGWPQAEQIPTLREVLDVAKGHVQAFIEIKPSRRGRKFGRYPHIAETVIQEVRRAEMLDQVLLMSFDWTILPLIKTIEPSVQTGALVSASPWKTGDEHAFATLIDQVKALGCAWIELDLDLFQPAMPAAAHEHGFKFGVWTVNTVAAMRHLAASGVDALTTDRPDLFASLEE
jgi:glycerophosphoryl diester phosphodiesterase